MSNYKLLDNEFLTLKEDSSYASPISSIFYEFYEDINLLQSRLESEREQIQCIVSNNVIPNSISFGHTQKPMLWDYADNIDTLLFFESTVIELFSIIIINYNVFVNNINQLLQNSNRFLAGRLRNLHLKFLEIIP